MYIYTYIYTYIYIYIYVYIRTSTHVRPHRASASLSDGVRSDSDDRLGHAAVPSGVGSLKIPPLRLPGDGRIDNLVAGLEGAELVA